MKIFLLSPNADKLFTKTQIKQLQRAGELILDKNPKPFSKISELNSGREKRILAIDPDFCEWKVANKTFDKIPNLKAVCLQTTSFSWVDVDYLGKKNIPILNLSGGFATEAVAEWAILMALNIARRIPLVIKDGWGQDYDKHQGRELKGKKAGIIGLGKIGKRIGEICQGLGMKVQYWSRKSQDNRFEYRELGDLMATSDYIFPALAKNKETQKLITDDMLKSMKKNANLVTISPLASLYNHNLVLKMIETDNLHGYAFEEDGGQTFNNYKGNVWAGPALAWVTKGSMERNAKEWVSNIIKAAKGNFTGKVN